MTGYLKLTNLHVRVKLRFVWTFKELVQLAPGVQWWSRSFNTERLALQWGESPLYNLLLLQMVIPPCWLVNLCFPNKLHPNGRFFLFRYLFIYVVHSNYLLVFYTRTVWTISGETHSSFFVCLKLGNQTFILLISLCRLHIDIKGYVLKVCVDQQWSNKPVPRNLFEKSQLNSNLVQYDMFCPWIITLIATRVSQKMNKIPF